MHSVPDNASAPDWTHEDAPVIPGTAHPGRHEGRVAVITGASRGIGKAVALRLAAEGAAVVIAAKSTIEAPGSLPGTIEETVREIVDGGGRAIGVQVDVRDEVQIEAMIEAAIGAFGRIDILFNNAGAIWLRGVADTPAKRYDLVHQINARASHLASHYALPHMVRQQWGHIVMFSPALHTDVSVGMSAYMSSKLAMTRTALAIAEEHRSDNIAANAIWPVTMIDTAAVRRNGLGDPSQWRTTEIVCDAFSELVSREPGECTGRELTDEELLSEVGIVDFDRYWVTGHAPDTPLMIAGPEAVLR
jgi:citronellol/citronellal dehydrogenase